MGIHRRVEYMLCCDGPDCFYSECSNWETRQQAEAAVEPEGWVRCSRGRLLCPKCKKLADDIVAGGRFTVDKLFVSSPTTLVTRLALVAALVLVAARAEAQTSVNLASNTSSFVIGSSPSPAALGEVTYNLSWTFPGASEPISFAVSGITSTTSFNMTADNAATYGLDWPNLLDSFANHHPGFGNITPGPTVSIETDLGEFDEPGCCGYWGFIRSTTGDGSTAPTIPTQLLVQITAFRQSTVEQGTVFTAITSLRGIAYLAPEPSTYAMLLPMFGLCVRRRYHG
jgi:hypothetical protein